MLSRNAQGLYWISRYLERAEHGCRVLINQFQALQDQTVEELDRIWSRLYLSLGREHLGLAGPARPTCEPWCGRHAWRVDRLASAVMYEVYITGHSPTRMAPGNARGRPSTKSHRGTKTCAEWTPK